MIAKYATVIAGSPLKNQPLADVIKPAADGRTHEFTNASASAIDALHASAAATCAARLTKRGAARSGKRRPMPTMNGVSAAQPYHCGASAMNARHAGMGWPARRENITVSSVESSVGIVQIPRIAHALGRLNGRGRRFELFEVGMAWAT